MKQVLIIILFTGIFAESLSAQVMIGSTDAPDKAKLLQLADGPGGLGLPRVQLVSLTTLQPFIAGTPNADDAKAHTGLMVYNLTTTGDFKQGIYVWDGAKWTDVAEVAGGSESNGKRWFYMPAFNLPMEEEGSGKTFDLYGVYDNQFDAKMGTKYGKKELDYAVVYYDDTVVKVNSITDEGLMTYEVLDTDPGTTSFMNIVFIVK